MQFRLFFWGRNKKHIKGNIIYLYYCKSVYYGSCFLIGQLWALNNLLISSHFLIDYFYRIIQGLTNKFSFLVSYLNLWKNKHTQYSIFH